MGLETPIYISDFVSTNPTANDPKAQGDDHIRNMKAAIKATFPNVTGAVTVTHSDINTVTAKASKTGDTYTGEHDFTGATVTVPTQSVGDSSTNAASTAFVAAQAFASALPAQTGNSGKLTTTNGTDASWTAIKTFAGASLLGAGDIQPAMALLATITPTASANIDALSVFTSSYDSYLIIGEGITTGTDDTLAIRLSVSGTVDAGANYSTLPSGTPTSATASSVVLSNTIYAGGKGGCFHLQISNANDATRLKGIYGVSVSQYSNVPQWAMVDTTAVYFAANAVSGVRFLLSGGSSFAATGKIRIYGISNT